MVVRVGGREHNSGVEAVDTFVAIFIACLSLVFNGCEGDYLDIRFNPQPIKRTTCSFGQPGGFWQTGNEP